MTGHFLIVTIDGGAASGKSTTARALSERLNLLHVDTGSHYRAVCFSLVSQGVDGFDEQVGQALQDLQIDTEVTDGKGLIKLNGRLFDASELRSEQVNANVSRYAAQPLVRKKLLDYQRLQAQVACESGFEGLVMEGRDIGSVIFPDAAVKVFLQADERERERRRAAEGQEDCIRKRDEMDKGRKTAPLACPEGAVVIDTGKLEVDQVVERVGALVRKVRS